MHLERNAFRSVIRMISQPATTRFAIKACCRESETGGFFEYLKFSVISHNKLSLLIYSNCSALFDSSENTVYVDKIMSPNTKIEHAAPSAP